MEKGSKFPRQSTDMQAVNNFSCHAGAQWGRERSSAWKPAGNHLRPREFCWYVLRLLQRATGGTTGTVPLPQPIPSLPWPWHVPAWCRVHCFCQRLHRQPLEDGGWCDCKTVRLVSVRHQDWQSVEVRGLCFSCLCFCCVAGEGAGGGGGGPWLFFFFGGGGWGEGFVWEDGGGECLHASL